MEPGDAIHLRGRTASPGRGIDRTKWYDQPRRLGAHFFDIVRVLSRLSPPVEQLVGGKLKSEQSRGTFSRNRKARLGILAPTISASRYLIVRDIIFGFLHRSRGVGASGVDRSPLRRPHHRVKKVGFYGAYWLGCPRRSCGIVDTKSRLQSRRTREDFIKSVCA